MDEARRWLVVERGRAAAADDAGYIRDLIGQVLFTSRG